ncbi:MAG: hypothetical protein HYV77_00835 [Candidatus Wildermuthbacteria bacterium]|nr:hypothetical protein [Candidatus Wildermuthbacteria bacterium]
MFETLIGAYREAIEFISETFPFLQSQWFKTIIFIVKIVMGAVGLILLSFIVWVLLKTSWIKFSFGQDVSEFMRYRAGGAQKRMRDWERIRKRLLGTNVSEYKLSILEADQMLDEVLRKLGIKGETMDDRLLNTPDTLVKSIVRMQEVHRTRNNIVRDPDYYLAQEEAVSVINAYEEAFRDLDLI